MTVFGYLRTSTRTNVGSEKDSDKRQRLAIESYVLNQGLAVDEWVYDPDVPGTEYASARPGLSTIVMDSKPGDMIIFENIGRLARDIMVMETATRALTQKGVRLVAADMPALFGESGSETFIRAIMGAAAQWEKTSLVEKLAGARARKAEVNKKRGVTTRSGAGKCSGRKTLLETTPGLVDALRKASRKPRGGKRPTLRAIAAKLADEGFTTVSGKHFSTTQISNLLKDIRG